MSDIEKKYFTTSDYNEFTNDILSFTNDNLQS